MEMERVFALSGLTVMPWWALMIFAPGWRWTRRLLTSPLILLAPGLLYAALVLPEVGTILPTVARPQLSGIAALLHQPRGATIAWVHFLAFDLFVGRWIYLDARERNRSWWVTSPLLFLTLMLGPLGLLGYLAARSASGQRLWSAGRELLRSAARGSRDLTAMGLASTALLVASLILQLVDPRQVLGVSTWLKPAKFGASVALNAIALALILARLRQHSGSTNPGTVGGLSNGLRRASRVITAMLGLELALITLQAARGVPSHFNAATRFDALVFQVMGIGITVMWLAQAYLTWRAFRQPLSSTSSSESPAVTWGIRLGLLAAVLGGGLGFIMPIPTAPQRESLKNGQPTIALGAHSVGVADGGPGLPVTRWNTSGGDLRVPHFIGLHGLQILPVLGWALSRRRRARNEADERKDGRLMIVAGLTYLGLIGTTLVQALRARPLLAPDTATLVVGGGILLAGVVLSLWIAAGHRRTGARGFVGGVPAVRTRAWLPVPRRP